MFLLQKVHSIFPLNTTLLFWQIYLMFKIYHLNRGGLEMQNTHTRFLKVNVKKMKTILLDNFCIQLLFKLCLGYTGLS